MDSQLESDIDNWSIICYPVIVKSFLGEDLIVESSMNTITIPFHTVKRDVSKTESDTPEALLNKEVILHTLKKYEEGEKIVYGHLSDQPNKLMCSEIDDLVVKLAIKDPDIAKIAEHSFFSILQHLMTLSDMLALLKEKLVNVKYQQKTCDLGSINRTEKFQERGVIIIDDDSESESSYKFDHEEPDAGIMLIRSDSESPTIDLAEEDEHQVVSAISITEEQIETHNDIEATFDFETLAIDEEKQPYPSLQSTFLEWLIQHYYLPNYNITCSEQFAWSVVITMKKLSISIETLYESFRNVINQGLSLDYFSTFLMGLKGFSDTEEKLLIADLLDPVLAFMVASLLPNKVLTRGLQNVLKGVKVESTWTRNFGIVVSDLPSKLGTIISDLGYVFFDKKMLKTTGSEKNHHRNLVFFHARQFSYQDLSWGMATKVTRVYEEPGDYETTGKLLKPRRRPTLDVDIVQRHAKHIRAFNQFTYEKAVIEEFSRRIFNRKSVDVLIVDASVSKSLEGLQCYFATAFGGTVFNANAAVKSNLYTSVWARLGFTETHLSIDYHFLYSFGGESCVFNSWLSLLYLVELPQSVNPLELVRSTIAYFNAMEKTAYMNYIKDFDKFNYNRALVENLVDELLGHRSSRNPIILEPFQSPSAQNSSDVKSQDVNELLLWQTLQFGNPLVSSQNTGPRFQVSNPPFTENLTMLPQSFCGAEVQPPLPFPSAAQRPLLHTSNSFVGPRGVSRPSTPLLIPSSPDGFLFRPRVPGAGLRFIIVESELCSGKCQGLPIDQNGFISMSTLYTHIPGSSSMKYKLGDGPWQQVLKFRDNFLPPPGGWEHYSYLVL